MSFFDVFEPVARLFRERGRRSFLADGRAHVEIVELGRDELPRFERALHKQATADGRVACVSVNAYLRRAIFVFEPGACPLSELVQWVEEAERSAGIVEAQFAGAPE